MASKCLPEAVAKREPKSPGKKPSTNQERTSEEGMERPKEQHHPWRRTSLMILEDVPIPALPRRLSVGSSALVSMVPPPPRPDPNRPLQNRPKDLLYQELVGTQLSSNITNCDKVASKCLPQVKPRKKALRMPGAALADDSSDEDAYDDPPVGDKPEDRLRQALLSCQGELQMLQKLVKGGPTACGLPPLRDADRTRFSQQTFSIEEAQREFCNDRLETALRLCLMNLNVLPPTASLDEEDEYQAAPVDWADVPLREDQEEEAPDLVVRAEIYKPNVRPDGQGLPEHPEEKEEKEGRDEKGEKEKREKPLESSAERTEEPNGAEAEGGEQETPAGDRDGEQADKQKEQQEEDRQELQGAQQQPEPEHTANTRQEEIEGEKKGERQEQQKEEEEEEEEASAAKLQQQKEQKQEQGQEQEQRQRSLPKHVEATAEKAKPRLPNEANPGASTTAHSRHSEVPNQSRLEEGKRGPLDNTMSTAASPVSGTAAPSSPRGQRQSGSQAGDQARLSTTTAATAHPKVPRPPHGSPHGARRPRQSIGQGGLRMSPGFKTFSD